MYAGSFINLLSGETIIIQEAFDYDGIHYPAIYAKKDGLLLNDIGLDGLVEPIMISNVEVPVGKYMIQFSCLFESYTPPPDLPLLSVYFGSYPGVGDIAGSLFITPIYNNVNADSYASCCASVNVTILADIYIVSKLIVFARWKLKSTGTIHVATSSVSTENKFIAYKLP